MILKEMSTEISDNFLSDNEKVYKALSSLSNVIFPINESRGQYIIRCKSCGRIGNCKMIAQRISEATNTKHVIKARHCGSISSNCSVSIVPIEGLEVYYSVARELNQDIYQGMHSL